LLQGRRKSFNGNRYDKNRFCYKNNILENFDCSDFLVVHAFMIIPAFRLFWLSGRSGFPVVLAFRSFCLACRSFWLSGLSGFPVVLAFKSFWLSVRSRFSSAVQVTACNQKKYKKYQEAQNFARIAYL
jgi:hypothetical protein